MTIMTGSALSPNVTNTLTLNGVKDVAANAIVPNTSIQFVFKEPVRRRKSQVPATSLFASMTDLGTMMTVWSLTPSRIGIITSRRSYSRP